MNNILTKMSWPYAYTPYIWPMLAPALFWSVLGIYGWRRRSVTGARWFTVMVLFNALWSIGAAMELAAVGIEPKIFWHKFQVVWGLPAATAELCFALQYTHLGHLLTRRNLAWLSIPPLLALLLVLTNDAHHWMWLGFSFEGEVRPLRSSLTWILLLYAYVLALPVCIALIRLFLRSPQHRWPVALVLCEILITRTVFLVDKTDANPFAPLDPTVLVWNVGAIMYGLALFGFRMFDPIPVARKTVIEQMQEGMLVLDTGQHIVDLNPAAERILGLPAGQVRGHPAMDLLPGWTEMSAGLDDPATAQCEISLGTGSQARHYALHLSPLKNRQGEALGHLLLLHDVTVQKRAQAQLLEQERALAMLSERERLARELHDSIGQVLGYVKMQAQAARDRLAQDQKAAADHDLAQLVAVAQDAHADVREYILGAKSATSTQPGFLPALRQYLQRFAETYSLRTELMVPPGLHDGSLEPTVEAQLLRIIQEALTNTRKHAHARGVQVSVQLHTDYAQVIVQDDGVGFDPALLAKAEGQKYGLGFMRERAEEVGGSVEIRSVPGAGTQVVICVPRRKEQP
ncbi:MAG: PAS domain S-box protein [Chloroflexi bacterium]|nr:PAS domain S-box protein [Chloroflexota bacterium]